MTMINKAEKVQPEEFLDKVYQDSYLLNISVKHIAPLIKKYLEKHPSINGKLIDVGCGNGSILRFMRDQFQERFTYTGLDFFENKDTEENNPITFLQGDLNKDFAEANNQHDVVIACEVIEHVIDTDHFITNVKKLLKPQGLLFLTTPNLSSFLNRILLLFGFQPLHTEVSWKNPYIGRELLYKMIGQENAPAAGHLRLFTSYALKKFLEFHGFEIVRKKGFTSYEGLTRIISKLFAFAPSLMPGILIVARLKS